MRRKLKNIDISEISLVDKGANRKKFAIVKRGKEPHTMLKKLVVVLKAFLGGVEVKDEEVAKAAEPAEDRGVAIEKAMKTLGEYDESLPDEATEAIQVLAKNAVLAVPAPAKEADEEITIEKVGARLSKSTLAELRKIKEVVDNLLDQKEDDEKKEVTKNLPVDVQKKLRRLEEIESELAAEARKVIEKKEKDLGKTITKLQEEIEELKKAKRVKKSLDGQDGDEEVEEDGEGEKGKKKTVKKDGVFVWGSLISAAHEEE